MELCEGQTSPRRKIPACYKMLRTSELACCCVHGNELLGSMKSGKFLD
jgi:hypothetical protein